MSREKCFCHGNGKRHRIPLLEGLRLRRLLCIGKERFKVLEECVKNSLFFIKPSGKKQLSHASTYKGQKDPVKEYRSLHAYEPTNIWATRESAFWQWRRVYEWFYDFKESYDV